MNLPEKYGRYEIKHIIGKGGMATVYLAHDPRFGRDVALKAIGVGYKDDPTFRNRFEREARTIATLEHPAIVPVYDFGEDNDQLYLVMRYMQNGTLTDRIVRGPMRGEQAIPIVRRMADALDHAHQNGVVHRDLKPGNILFDQYERAYLSDFGIVKLAAEGTDADLTGTGVIGTPAYMSPEQIHGDSVIDGRSDIYTLGIILFEMLTGRKPYRADTPVKQMMAHIMEPIPDITRYLPNFPTECITVIRKALAKEPENRYQTAKELTADLSATLTGNHYSPIPRPYSPTLGSADAETITEDPITLTNLELPKEVDEQTVVPDSRTVVNPNISEQVMKPVIPAVDAPALTDAPLVDERPLKTEPASRRRWPLYAVIGLVVIAIVVFLMVQSGNRPDTETESDEPIAVVEGEETAVATEEVDEEVFVAEETPIVEVTPVQDETPMVEQTAVPQTGAFPSQFDIGQTVNGESIEAFRFGDGEQVVLLVGGIHAGYAPATVDLMRRFVDDLNAEALTIPEDVTLFIVPNGNPDSVSRTNANGVDINHNWACNWQANPANQTGVARGLGGERPFSEPETVALRDFIQQIEPNAVLIWQAAVPTGWVSPGKCGAASRYSSVLANSFSAASGFFQGDIGSLSGQAVSGDMAGWLDSQGVPAIAIWLPNRDTADVNTNVAGLNAVLAQVSDE